MKICKSLENYISNKNSIVTIGAFDGIHSGHQKILKYLVENSDNGELDTIVLTFDKHPRSVLDHSSNLKILTLNEEKILLFQKMNIGYVVFQNFDRKFSEMSGREFVENVLVRKLKAKKVLIGYDHRFGKNRECGIKDLIGFGNEFGFDVEEISAQEINENKVSSTKIRQAILDGQIELASLFLGYDYFLSGKVIKGNQIGRTIGFPTANLELESDLKMLPKNGVYVVKGIWEGSEHNGVMNIGVRPTIDGHKLSLEINFFDIDEDLYGKIITISFCCFIREEKKFDNIEELKNQIFQDKEFAMKYFLDKHK